MKYQIQNQSSHRAPQKFLKWWIPQMQKLLLKSKRLTQKQKKWLKTRELIVVFIGEAKGRELNKYFMEKNYPTDVLSFEPIEDECLGELALCIPVIRKQAEEHEILFRDELGYVVLHGVLHLLGFEHEFDEAAAKKMFRIQDEIYDTLCTKYQKSL